MLLLLLLLLLKLTNLKEYQTEEGGNERRLEESAS
jgi:hypothetical protein